jgi:hypothetical protein
MTRAKNSTGSSFSAASSSSARQMSSTVGATSTADFLNSAGGAVPGADCTGPGGTGEPDVTGCAGVKATPQSSAVPQLAINAAIDLISETTRSEAPEE